MTIAVVIVSTVFLIYFISYYIDSRIDRLRDKVDQRFCNTHARLRRIEEQTSEESIGK